MLLRDKEHWMLAEALDLLKQADRLHRQFFQLEASRGSGPHWEPPVDIFETEQEILILVALPGVAADKFDVIIEDGTLFVVGERPIPASATAAIRRLEIPYGRFERRITLPPGRLEIWQRDLANGCLLITLRKLS